jgi:hypothetical protein
METTPKEEAQATPQEEVSEDINFEDIFQDEDPQAEQDKFLAQINKIEGRNYKTIDDWSKTNLERKKIADKFYSEQGQREKKEEPKVEKQEFVSNDKYAEKLLKLENPNSQFVMDELKQISKERGIDILEAWDKFTWIRKEAEARAEAETETEKDGKKVSKPSSKITGKKSGDTELSEADRALLSRRPGLMDKYIKQSNK